jgi:3',5'-cyclic AMP phosphodiesterase CpdA
MLESRSARPLVHLPYRWSVRLRNWSLLVIGALTPSFAQSWKFAVLADTQWPDTVRLDIKGPDGKILKDSNGSDSTILVDGDSLSGYKNPNMVPAFFLHQIHERFRQHGVRFVLAAGDLTDYPTLESMRTRATWAQELYDAGIGFFPIRGNHDEGPIAAQEFVRVFPQTKTGRMNATPQDAFLWTDSANIHPFRATYGTFSMGSSFSSPSCAKGRSYAFSDQGSTFVMLDQFMGTISEGVKVCPMSVQIPWMDSVLKSRSAGTPAFVVTHKPVIGATHADNLFGDDPTVDTAGQARFFEILERNGVELLMAGHDHQLQHSVIEEPGARGLRIQQVIFPGASYKFYPPLIPTVDSQYNLPGFGKHREFPLAQDLGTIGYTIVEVDGPRVELSAWGAPSGIRFGELTEAPDLSGKWGLRRRWGWSPRGKQTLLTMNDSLKVLGDSSEGTRVRILSGTWKAGARDLAGRNMHALASTDWRRLTEPLSAAWTLWGLEKAPGSLVTPSFAMAMSVDATVSDSLLGSGEICLGREDSATWKCAGTGTARQGAWKSSDPVGARGVDLARGEVWAVVDRGGTYAAISLHQMAVSPVKSVPTGLRLEGRKLTLLGLAQTDATVEISDAAGRILERGFTKTGVWNMSPSLHGALRVRVRAAGQAWSVGTAVVVPRAGTF